LFQGGLEFSCHYSAYGAFLVSFFLTALSFLLYAFPRDFLSLDSNGVWGMHSFLVSIFWMHGLVERYLAIDGGDKTSAHKTKKPSFPKA
jgi:hypothetical protein